MQAQATSVDAAERYTNTWIAFRSIYKTEGWRAFYRGLAPSLIGVTHVAVHFPLYEKMKSWSGERCSYIHRDKDWFNRVFTDIAPEDGGPLNSQRILFCSALSKMVASVITYPHEVLRTRLQIQKRERATAPAMSATASPSIGISKAGHTSPGATLRASANHGLLKTITTIASQDGWKGFYRGISINLVRTVPASAVTMLTYVSITAARSREFKLTPSAYPDTSL
jgi:solute carrier family 25 folate transporter 32